MTSSVISVHLLTILQERGFELAAAVALGALVGPSQVGARLVEMAFGSHYHPIWTLAASTLLMAAGFGLLLSGFPIVAVALVLYGAGIGIKSIARGTLPLALFGRSGYATLMGRLALPSLLAQALSPSLGAILLERGGSDLTLAVLTAMSARNVLIVAILWAACFRIPKAASSKV